LEPQAERHTRDEPTHWRKKERHLHGSGALEVADGGQVCQGDPPEQDNAIADDEPGNKTCDEPHDHTRRWWAGWPKRCRIVLGSPVSGADIGESTYERCASFPLRIGRPSNPASRTAAYGPAGRIVKDDSTLV